MNVVELQIVSTDLYHLLHLEFDELNENKRNLDPDIELRSPIGL